MLWAAFCLSFFGFLRPGELTFASNFPYSELTVSDIAIDSRDNPRVLIVRIWTSKTDQFGKGTQLYLGRTEGSLCLLSSMLAYLALRPPTPGPLFIFQDGSPLSRGQLTAHLRAALCNVGLQSTRFSGRSFRIAAASTSASAVLSDSFIQKLGRWKSSAFTRYIRTPQSQLIESSVTLASTSVLD